MTAFLLVFLIYKATGQTLSTDILQGIFLFGIASTGQDVLGTSWSLDLEMQFYLFVPLIAATLSRWGNMPMPILIAGVAVLTFLGWWLQLQYGVWTFLSYLPSFAMGAAIWHYKWRASGQSAAIGVGAFLVIWGVVAMIPWLQPLLFRTQASPFHEDWFGMACVLLLTPFVIWNVSQKSSKWDMHLGNFSYALYITHWPVIYLLRQQLDPLTLFERGLILIVIVVIAILFYILVDRNWETVRRRIIS